MTNDVCIELGLGPDPVCLTQWDISRHMLICGVTGAGKTTTAKVIAEALAAQRVSVFITDAKGDFAGIAQAHAGSDTATTAISRSPYRVTLWDPEGRWGRRFDLSKPIRSEQGPIFGELLDDQNGDPQIGVLHVAELIRRPDAYAALIFELVAQLSGRPNASDSRAGVPQLVLVVEEAHLLFRHLSRDNHATLVHALQRLNHGCVSVVFVAPDPAEIPSDIDLLVGTRIQHALWSPSIETLARLRAHFRSKLGETDAALREMVRTLGIGEALVSSPEGAQRRVQIQRPQTRDGPITAGERRTLAAAGGSPSPSRPRRIRPSRR